MRKILVFGSFVLFVVLNVCMAWAETTSRGIGPTSAHASSGTWRLNFDEVKAGELPSGWKIDATHPGKRLAGWNVVADPEAPSGPNVLALTRPGSNEYNLFWTNSIPFKDGNLEVNIRADKGKEDQGGGLIWRVLDANNYYVTRYNPLEKNLRLYYVKRGRRVQLADVKADIKSGEWFKITVLHHEEMITVLLNGQKVMQVKDDNLLAAGGVGFWTKADAATSFDDFLLSLN